jgi:Ca2+-binding RTX toxin-like protein
MAINGTNGNDSFRGTSFADEIFGFGGDDEIFASPGGDTIDGGVDDDVVDYQAFFPHFPSPAIGSYAVIGGAVDVDLERSTQSGGLAEGDVLIDVENITGSTVDDVIKGNSDDNVLGGGGGHDILEGREGDDLLAGDTVFGFFLGGVTGNDHLDGGQGNDELFGDGGDDTLIGGQGLDSLDGGTGVDVADYSGSAAAVTIHLNAGIGIGGDAAGDVLQNMENVIGSAFADTLNGSSAINVLTGGNGNDKLAGLGGADTLDGGNGTDTVTYAASASGVTVDLTLGDGSGGDATNDTLISIENLTGSNFVDSLVGNASANVLDGGGSTDLMAGKAGNDIYIVDNAGDVVIESAGQGIDEVRASVSFTLTGGAEVETLRTTNEAGTTTINLTGNNIANTIVGNNGNNAINGGGGADTLIGARGVDILTGGSGADRFVWRDANESGVDAATADTIVDFDPLAGELIDLSGIDADVFAAGNQAFTFIGAAGFSGTPGEVNFVQVNGDTIIQLQTGQAVDVDMAIRIQGIITPDATMFLL